MPCRTMHMPLTALGPSTVYPGGIVTILSYIQKCRTRWRERCEYEVMKCSTPTWYAKRRKLEKKLQ
jgi:hypothetical protein